MNALGILVLLSGPLLGFGWLIAEFKAARKWRILLGCLSLVALTAVTWFATLVINQFNYNSSYGFAAKSLIEETVKGIESGQSSIVLVELRRLQDEYHPTYENRAKFVPLVEATVARLKLKNEGHPQNGGTNAVSMPH